MKTAASNDVLLGDDALLGEIATALASVDDPEYPGVSIVDLGMVEAVAAVDGHVRVELVPTYGGCPALRFIAEDVRNAITALPRVTACDIEWLRTPVWSTDRVAPGVAAKLGAAFTVTIRRSDGSLVCPVCGSGTVRDTAPMGPSRCRSLAWCDECRNPVEVMR